FLRLTPAFRPDSVGSLERGSMRTVQLFALVLLATTAAQADNFYPCSSGVIDCSPANWQKHWYGDFGLSGKIALNASPLEVANGFGRFFPQASNRSGTSLEVPIPASAARALVMLVPSGASALIMARNYSTS